MNQCFGAPKPYPYHVLDGWGHNLLAICFMTVWLYDHRMTNFRGKLRDTFLTSSLSFMTIDFKNQARHEKISFVLCFDPLKSQISKIKSKNNSGDYSSTLQSLSTSGIAEAALQNRCLYFWPSSDIESKNFRNNVIQYGYPWHQYMIKCMI